MQTADFNVDDFERQNQAETDKSLLVKFFIKARPDQQATLEAGHPQFKDVEYIDIKIPGSRTGGACRPATFQDKQRFAQHYAMFKQRVEEPTDGHPLSEWPLVTRSQVEQLAFHNVKTVEHLANMADSNVSNFMGMNTLKAKAKLWLEQAGEKANEAKLQAQLAERDERIAALEKKIDLMLTGQVPQQKIDETLPPPITPSLASDLDDDIVEDEVAETPPKVAKPKARRKRRAKRDGAIQDDK